MAQSKGENIQLSFLEESTLGTTPSGTPKKIPYAGNESLGTERGVFVSAQNKADRMVTEIRPGTMNVKGDVPFELDTGTWGTWFKHLLGSASTAGSTHTIKGGSALPSGGLSLEKGFLDLGKYLVFRGCRANTLSVEIPASGLITGTWGLIGVAEGGGSGSGAGSAASSSLGTPSDITDLPITSWEASVDIGGSANSKVSAVAFTVNNNLQEDGFVLGSRIRRNIIEGQRVVNGTVTLQFEDIADYNTFVNQGTSSLKITCTRGSYSIEFFFPSIVFGGGDATPKSAAGPITAQLPWQAKKDATEGTDIKVTIVNSQGSI